MARMRSMVTIARPVEEVFGFFLALDENVPRTDPTVESVVKDPAGAESVNVVYENTASSIPLTA